jgi:hypothetical protein
VRSAAAARRTRVGPRAVVALALVLACGHHEGPPARRAFYYWRTTFALSDGEQRALGELGVTRLYVRAFDVVWNDKPEIAGKLVVQTPFPAIEIVPVVFVRDEVLAKGKGVAPLITDQLHALGFSGPELQLDCDWTDKTRDAFFQLARDVHATSSTIRLHQVKYRERTGVPPVARGMLMFYNMGRFRPDPDNRVIFDPATAAKYLDRVADYPLPLDVALPIWSWVVQIRDDRVIDLLQSTDPDELSALDFLRRDGDRYVATRNAFLHGVLLREGDVLAVEITAPSDALAAAKMIAPHLPAVEQPRTVTLFDLSDRNLARHGTQALDQVFRAVR